MAQDRPGVGLAVGMCGKPLPPQNGGPVRLLLPWKYGFKSGRSLVRIRLADVRPPTFWSALQPSEYGFWANVTPDVPHPLEPGERAHARPGGARAETHLQRLRPLGGRPPWRAARSGALPMTAAGGALLGVALLLALLHGDALGALIFALDGGLLPRLQASVQRRLSPGLWEHGIQPLLDAPSSLFPGALGLLLLALGLRRRAQARRSASAVKRSAAQRP